MSDSILSIRKALLAEVSGIQALTRAYDNELGYVSPVSLRASVERGEVFVARDGCCLAGFVNYHHRRDTQTTIHEIAVRPSCRGRKVGRALIEAVVEEASTLQKEVILLKCLVGLPANDFYQHMGFVQQSIITGRKRPLVVWSLSLTTTQAAISSEGAYDHA